MEQPPILTNLEQSQPQIQSEVVQIKSNEKNKDGNLQGGSVDSSYFSKNSIHKINTDLFDETLSLQDIK